MKLRSLLAGALLAVAGLAHAQVTLKDLGPLNNTAATLGGLKAQGLFVDVYDFLVGGPGIAAAGVLSVPLDIDTLPGVEFNIDFLGLVLIGPDGAPLAVDFDPTGGFTLASLLPTAGTYRFGVIGVSDGTLGGAYGGLLQTLVAEVPEPEAYAMMLAGLGALGFLARRRRPH